MINMIDGGSSEQELIVSISWLSILSIDHDQYERRVFFRATVDCIYQLTVDRYDRRGFFKVRVDCVDQLTVDRVDWERSMWSTGFFRARVDCVGQLTVDRIDWSWSIRSTCVLQSNNRLCRSTDCRSCRLITIDTIDACSSEQTLIVSIKWLSIVSIVNDRYDWQEFFRAKVDCVDLLTIDRVDW